MATKSVTVAEVPAAYKREVDRLAKARNLTKRGVWLEVMRLGLMQMILHQQQKPASIDILASAEVADGDT